MEQGLQDYPEVDSTSANGENANGDAFSTKHPTQQIRCLTAEVRYPKSEWKLPVHIQQVMQEKEAL